MRKALIALLIACLTACALVTPVAAAGREQPTVVSTRIDCFFDAARPGDTVKVFVKATRPGGIKQMRGHFNRSPYLREGGKGEMMTGLEFLPTGEPDEFCATFTVPATIDGHPDKPLPDGGYRGVISGGVDGNGNGYGHPHVVISTLRYAGAEGPAWKARLDGERFVHDGKGSQLTLRMGRRRGTSPVKYHLDVLDYFGAVCGDSLTGEIDFKPGERKSLTFTTPARQGARQYRLKLNLTEVDDSGATLAQQTIEKRLIADLVTGPRRELHLDDSPNWEHIPAKELADTPPQGKWQKGRSFPVYGRDRFNKPFSRFGEGTAALWVRTTFRAPDWLVGRRYEIYFGEIGFACDVYVNGKHVGEHTGPYYPFSIDMTDVFKPGLDNVIALRVRDTTEAHSKAGELFADPVLAQVAPHAPAAASRMSGRLLWPMHTRDLRFGVIGPVRVRAFPDVYIDDVFVMPSVRDKQLKCRITIRNSSSKDAAFVLAGRVLDGDRSVLECEGRRLTLDAGQVVTVDVIQPWENPKLWWPHDPFLYKLRMTVGSDDGTIMDRCDTRFGFREICVDGRDFRLNGKRLKARMQVVGFSPRMTHDQAKDDLDKWMADLRKRGQYGPIIARLHLFLASYETLDIADELGILAEVGGPLRSVRSDWTSPQMWDNYKKMLTDWVMRDRNHPSVAFWDVENETLVCTNTMPTLYDSNRKRLLELGEHVRKLDPTRPILFEGDSDVDGSWNTINLHYPRYWYVHPDLPNSAFWLKYGQANMKLDMCYPHALTWNTPKPIFLGEDGMYIEAYPPHDLSSLGGDNVYQLIDAKGPWGGASIDDQGHAMYVEGYRDSEVSVTSTTLGGTGGPACDRAHLPVRSFVRQRSSRFYSGKTIKRDINLHHDLLVDADVTFAWSLEQGDETLQQGETSFQMTSGDLERFAVELKMPTVDKPTSLAFVTSVTRAGKRAFTETHDYTVYPAYNLRLPEGVRLGIFDRARKTSLAFRQQGIPFVEFGTIEPGTVDDLKQLNCLLIGEGGLDQARLPRLRPALDPYLQAGGVIICLRQESDLEWICSAKPLPLDLRRTTTISWPRSPDHPILKGITNDMLRYWNEDNIVSTADFLKAPRTGWRPIVDSGGLQGLRWASIVEMPVGRGAIVFCQMHLINKIEGEPATMRLLENLVAYAATRKPTEPAGIRTIAVKDSPMVKRLKSLGIELNDDADAEVVVVDAGVNTDEQLTTSLAQQLVKGRTVLLHGLTPENLGAWDKLLPTDVELKKVDKLHAVRVAQHPLLAGISATDLWWGQYHIWGFTPEGAVQIAYAASVRGEATELVGEGGLIAIPVGTGRLLIDQLLWEKQDVHQERSGQYISLLLHNLARRHALR